MNFWVSCDVVWNILWTSDVHNIRAAALERFFWYSSDMDMNDVPVMIYDGACRFCKVWIRYWKERTGDRVSYVPFQDGDEHLCGVSLSECREAVQIITPDGTRYSGAEAVFFLLSLDSGGGAWLRLYNRLPGFGWMARFVYRWIARHRGIAYWFTRVLWGRRVVFSSYRFVSWLFVRVLGVIYFIAFVSLSGQLMGLIGRDGISPAQQFLDAAGSSLGSFPFFQMPTLFWLGAGDGALMGVVIGGVILSLLLIAGVLPRLVLAVVWVFYLSLVVVGQQFMSFQWDILLLEVGFLAIFLAPMSLFSRPRKDRPPSRLVVWLFRALLFRLVFLSGVVKLASGDIVWRNLTALMYHYETQPLPVSFAWYMHQLPLWFHKISVVFMFGIELAVPFLFFAPRRIRFFGAWIVLFFQGIIIVTGNYTFFNWLTIALALFLFDDAFFRVRILDRVRAVRPQGIVRRAGLIVLAVCVLTLGFLQIVRSFGPLPRVAAALVRTVQPFYLVNHYGLFAVMTTVRREIILQGSRDNETWKTYTLRYQPGDLLRAPRFVAPHQPRLDWQMWFAALGTYERNPWLVNTAVRLLQGSSSVLALLDDNPFGPAPPKFVRGLIYEYHFTNFEERRDTGAWWRRELLGLYLPVVSFTEE